MLKAWNSQGCRNIVETENQNGRPKIVIPASELFGFTGEEY
jgi:hypothetical protein